MLKYIALLLSFTALFGAECPNELLKFNKTSKESTTLQNNELILKNGWNYLHRSESGIDIKNSFADNKEIKSVCAYDAKTKRWASFPKDKKYLSLEKIEPNTGFYIYANKDTKIKIETTEISSTCKKFMDDKKYAFLTDSGIDNALIYNNDKTMAFQSRYGASFLGVYSDTRVVIIYPKLQASNSKIMKYGPARPRSYIEYAKEYENKYFYMYDYRQDKCYIGIFPSRKVPPFASLKEIK